MSTKEDDVNVVPSGPTDQEGHVKEKNASIDPLINISEDPEITKEDLELLEEEKREIESSLSNSSDPNGSSKAFLAFLNTIERKVPFHKIDFLTEFGATELFFISGDALLCWAFEQSHNDFNRNGGQSLPLLWTVEKFLQELLVRNGTFRIFFFKDYQSIWEGKKAMARNLIVNHLRERTDIPIDEFEFPWQDPKTWKAHLDHFQAAFLLLKLTCKEQKDVKNLNFEIIQKAFLALYQNDHVLDVDEIEFVGSKVIAFSAEPSRTLEEYLQGQNLPAKLVSLPSLKRNEEDSSLKSEGKDKFEGSNLRSRIFLEALSTFLSNEKDLNGKQVLLSKLLVHYLNVLEAIPLTHRVHSLPSSFTESGIRGEIDSFLDKICRYAEPLLRKTLSSGEKRTERDAISLADLYDFKLYYVIVILAEDCEEEPKEWKEIVEGKTLPSIELIGSSQFKQDLSDASKSNVTQKREKVPKFNSEMLNQLIPDFLEKRYEGRETEDIGSQKQKEDHQTFKADYHFHSSMKLNDGLDKYEFKKQEVVIPNWKQLKLMQKSEAALTKYAQNLLQDSVIKRVVLAQEDTTIERQRKKTTALDALKDSKKPGESGGKSEEKEVKKKGKKVEKQVVKKADLIRQKVSADKHTKNQSSHQTRLDHLQSNLKTLLKNGKHSGNECRKLLEEIERHAVECFNEKQYSVGTDAVLVVTDFWESMQTKEGFKASSIVERVYCLLQLILRACPPSEISESQKNSIHKMAELTGFSDFVSDVETHLEFKPKASKSKKEAKPKENEKKSSNSSAIRYQLLNVSYNLRRPKGKSSDLRVNFMPDDWQRKLLDVIDAEESALICAATSSGKTFASFYAMESVLRLDSNSVMVFVAPSKALVNQMEAEICARFSKNYKAAGKYVCGVFTRDFRKNMDNCQVLVTVPACLEILMMSPSRVGWTRNIKYVVLDEVHCIGQENGEVWQRLLLMLPCPFLALSATIGNLQDLYEWMKGISESRGRRMHLVHHKERYNYLKLTYLDTSADLKSLNPLFAVNTKSVIRSGEMPDVKLLPQDCIGTLNLLKDIKDQKLHHEWRELQPEQFFSYMKNEKTWNIGMSEASEWERRVKEFFIKCLQAYPKETEEILAKSDVGMKTHSCEKDEDVFQLLEQMRSKDLLPTIVFHLNRAGCEKYALSLSRKLAKEEENYRREKGTQEKIEKLQEQIEKESVREKRDRDIIEQAQAEEKEIPADVESRRDHLLSLKNKLNLISQIDPKHAFFLRNVAVTMEDIKEHWKWAKKEDPLVQALMRGIGVHHGGLDKGYRKAVERMFRLRQLSVIFGTATLSLGLNMPCKSVVICRDSIFLNGIQFRQMSGRAGRRGFDQEGIVILAGLPESKIKRLLANRLPDIISSSPVTPTSVLRLLTMYECTKKDPYGLEVAKTFLNHPLSFFKSNGVSKQTVMKSHMLFSAEYLLREGIVNQEGVPIASAGVVHHLFYLEPENFWVAALLRSGAFDCLVQENVSVIDQQLHLMEVLANIFFRIPLHKSQLLEKNRGPSIVLLPSLPKSFSNFLKQHEKRLRRYTLDYAHFFVEQFRDQLPADDVLPLSGLSLVPSSSSSSTISDRLKESSGKREIVSSFVAMSGVREEESSLTEVCDTLRNGIAIDKAIMPVNNIEGDVLNCFAVDFLRHGIASALIRYNRIRHEILWESLREFSLVLSTLAVEARMRADGLKVPSPPAEAIAKLFEGTSNTFKEQFANSFAQGNNKTIPVPGV
eukprot:TRINITY_DN5469_c0_g1_i1.p1 TRINITY_DN5469_c0_g1~~TRINITY_DN5469_c0_g1_i1.p1  ORF type:complete len:1744 (+),score=799.57 TRINITY_DN5469_c0_g1_i1:145-5376(+)